MWNSMHRATMLAHPSNPHTSQMSQVTNLYTKDPKYG